MNSNSRTRKGPVVSF
jgi:hypothetical protein